MFPTSSRTQWCGQLSPTKPVHHSTLDHPPVNVTIALLAGSTASGINQPASAVTAQLLTEGVGRTVYAKDGEALYMQLQLQGWPGDYVLSFVAASSGLSAVRVRSQPWCCLCT